MVRFVVAFAGAILLVSAGLAGCVGSSDQPAADLSHPPSDGPARLLSDGSAQASFDGSRQASSDGGASRQTLDGAFDGQRGLDGGAGRPDLAAVVPDGAPDRDAVASHDAAVPPADGSPGYATFQNIVATLRTEVTAAGVESCERAGAPGREEQLWDVGLPPYSVCRAGRPICLRGSRPIVTAMVTGADQRQIAYHACVAADLPTATGVVATVYSRWDARQVDVASRCVTAAGDRSLDLWDAAVPFGGCDALGRPRCLAGSHPLQTALARLPDGSIESYTACLLSGQAEPTQVVGTIYSERQAEQPVLCLDATSATAAAAGYWQASPGLAACVDGRPKCGRLSRPVVLAATELGYASDARVKYHTVCLRDGDSDPLEFVATISSRGLSDGRATCGATPASYWDPTGYVSCDEQNKPYCLDGARKVVTAMARRSDGSVDYSTACLAPRTSRRPTSAQRLTARVGGRRYGWYTHGFYADPDGTFRRFVDRSPFPEQRFPDNLAPICEMAAYSNTGIARSPEDVARLAACGGYETIVYGFNHTPVMKSLSVDPRDSSFDQQFWQGLRAMLQGIRSTLARQGLLDDVDIWYIADEPALHRDVFRDQAFLDRYVAVFREEIPYGKVAMHFAQDVMSEDPVRGAHYDPPPGVDIILMTAFFWQNELPCEAAAIRRFVYRDNPHSALDWAFQFEREVYLVGWAMVPTTGPLPGCYVDQTFQLFLDDSRIAGLLWFIYDSAFNDGGLRGAAQDGGLVGQIKGFTLGPP